MKKSICILLITACVLSWALPVSAAKIQFKFNSWDGPQIKVFMTRPVGMKPDRPVIFVMHGTNRNADDCRDQWHALALHYDFLLVVPEFSHRGFPGAEGYNLGNVYDRDGNRIPASAWAFSAVEPIFDEIRRRFAVTTENYSLYGHSAGAQFVHRFILHTPAARLSQIVVANAGWYMMPDFGTMYPYGLKNSAVSREMLASALRLPVTILLADSDIDPNLRRSPEAMAQGDHRLARGQTFFDAARAVAGLSDVPFNWRLEVVKDAGHDQRLMAPAAIPYLLGD
jgi:poly(3-hydroxybutyrate) depolymerase